MYIIAIFVTLGCLASDPSDAAIILTVNDTATQLPTGSFHYLYEIHNQSASTESLISFRVDVPDTVTLAELVAPAGWITNYLPGDITVEWESSDFSFDIAPSTFGAFGFVSDSAPGPSKYGGIGLNEMSLEFSFVQGAAVAPVPEPWGGLLFEIAIMIALWRQR
jgi:hypothetical protein